MTTFQHPDALLIEAAAQVVEDAVQDGDTDNGKAARDAVSRIVGPLVDPDVAHIAARERVDPIMSEMPELFLLSPESALRAAWMDGFVLGVLFQQSGGHTEL